MRNIKLTKNQWQRISEILANLGVVSIASLVIPFAFDMLKLPVAILGLTLAFI